MLIPLALGIIPAVRAQASLLFVPLDQRFTTRVAFLNLARLTDFSLVTLPDQLLPARKKYSSPDLILDWTVNHLQSTDHSIVSLESVLYGSLIASRISPDPLAAALQRLGRLLAAGVTHLSAVVMRIPAYNGDFEEPDYWKNYGRSIFLYSFYGDKFNQTGDKQAQQSSQKARAEVPLDVLSDYLARRSRNQQVLKALLRALPNNKLVRRLVITQDDNAQYGLNVRQAAELKELAASLGLQDRVLIYAGADEAQLVLLSSAALLASGLPSPNVTLAFRNVSSSELIPNYEGAPMVVTAQKQVQAAGGTLMPSSKAQVQVLINNFDTAPQKEAVQQNAMDNTSYSVFDKFVCSSASVLAFADSRFSNGADLQFVDYVLARTRSCGIGPERWSYAGWNTNGNTLGTAIANAILLYATQNMSPRTTPPFCSLCSPCRQADRPCANAYFNILRVTEDRDWQALNRQLLREYMRKVKGLPYDQLDFDLEFYERFSQIALLWQANQTSLQIYGKPLALSRVYYPWNRTFQIGLAGSFQKQLQE